MLLLAAREEKWNSLVPKGDGTKNTRIEVLVFKIKKKSNRRSNILT